MANPRETALKILYAVDFEGAYSNMALKDQLGRGQLSPLDKGFITSLVYGVISRRLTLDYVIGKYSSVKLKKLSPYVLEILRMGIYQLFFMDRVPDSAAVNESVKLTRRWANRSSGFVNGVLRSAAREQDSITWPTEPMEALSVRESFPLWLCEKWTAAYGGEFAGALMKALNKPPEMTIRANLLKTTREALEAALEKEGVKSRPLELAPEALAVSGLDAGHSDLYRSGCFTVQDPAAMLAARVLNPKKGERVLDLCAAPGGKTTHLAQLMNNKGEILAFDLHAHKCALIEENGKRMGLEIIRTRLGDMTVFSEEFRETADKVLADVPCSGLGIIRRKPEIKWNKTEHSDIHLIQKQILENAGRYLKKGGELVYSTCTLDPEENEGVTQAFLKEHPEFEGVDIRLLLPEALRKDTGAQGYVTLYPNTDETDGFYICKMRKKHD